MKRIVVFDLDDTLFPEWQFVLSGFRAVDESLRARNIQGFYASAEKLFKSGARGNIFDLALAELGHPSDKSLIAELLQTYREHRPTLALFEDARWAIDYFKARGPLGLISDGYQLTQQNKFAALNIADCFKAVVFSDCLGRDCWKPSPKPYQKIMELIPAAATDYVYIADNPNKDFLAPRQLGWHTIQIDRREGIYHNAQVAPEYHAHKIITDLRALEKM
jgi:putative hydrolase of the HAD superfamily